MSHSTSNLLEICLKQIGAGATIDQAVAPYPEQANELRELLEIAIVASKAPTRRIRVPASAQVDSRELFLAQAQQLQQQRGAMYWWSSLHFLRTNVGSLSFGVAILLLFFLAISSVRALPGDSLYPVKLAAEQAGVSLPGSAQAREQRVQSFDSQRTAEVAQMIQMKRTGEVSFGGFLKSSLNGSGWQVDEIPLQVAQPLEKQAADLAGARVEIQGFLNEQGLVQVASLQPRLDTIEGTLNSVAPDKWLVGSQEVRVSAITQVSGTPRVGSQVSVQVAALQDTSVVLGIKAEIKADQTPAAPATATQKPVNTERPQVTVTRTPEDTPASTATADHGNKDRPIIQPSGQSAPTAGSSGGSGGEGPSQPQPTDDHHGGDNSGSSGSSGSKDGGHPDQ